MNASLKIAGLACTGFIALAAHLSAVVVVYQFPLSGLEEVPPNASPATGFATVTLDTESNLLAWDVVFSGFQGTYTNAHFHGPAAPGVNTGTLVGIHQAEFLGQTSGQLVGSTTLTNMVHKQHILDGLTYINLHSTVFPGGEIRGQVIPEPSTYAMFAGLLALAGACYWRRRR
jgi:hypothetical protein